jgi:hypothetical protein
LKQISIRDTIMMCQRVIEEAAMAQPESVNPMDDVNLFISHKKDDYQAAEDIRDTLTGRSGRLRVHLFEDSLAGTNIEGWIKEHLADSEILLFLYNDPSADWNWCFVEIGKYTELPAPRNVICICSEHISWPAPLQGIQNVRADSKELVAKFLDPFYRSNKFYAPKNSLNENITDDQLTRIAEKIVLLMQPRELKPYYYSERFLLTIDDVTSAKDLGIPEDAHIQVHGQKSDIFDLHTPNFDWKTLMSRVPGGEQSSWAKEMHRAVKAVAGDFGIPVQTTTIRSSVGGDIFRPILYRVDRLNGVPRDFHILFVKELSPNGVGGPGLLGTMFNLMRFANRYRYEVVRPALERIAGLVEEERETFLVRIQERIRAVEDDAERNNLFGRSDIIAGFDGASDPDGATMVEELLKEWDQVRPVVQQALSTKSMEMLTAELRSSDRIFGELLRLGAARYSELVSAQEDARMQQAGRQGRSHRSATRRRAGGRRTAPE